MNVWVLIVIIFGVRTLVRILCWVFYTRSLILIAIPILRFLLLSPSLYSQGNRLWEMQVLKPIHTEYSATSELDHTSGQPVRNFNQGLLCRVAQESLCHWIEELTQKLARSFIKVSSAHKRSWTRGLCVWGVMEDPARGCVVGWGCPQHTCSFYLPSWCAISSSTSEAFALHLGTLSQESGLLRPGLALQPSGSDDSQARTIPNIHFTW